MSAGVSYGSNSHNNNGVSSAPINTFSASSECFLESFGIPSSIAQIFQHFYNNGKLKEDDFDDRAIDALKSLSIQDAIEISVLFETTNLEQISNKSAHLCGSIRYVRARRKSMPYPTVYQEVHKPNQDRINEILNRTGYPYECTSGQRKYGPAPNVDKAPVADGHEIYIGSVPYSVCEDDLIPMMERCGTIFDLRMMVDPATGRNKGFCFVTFIEDDAVSKAVEMYNGLEMVPGMKIRVNPSIPNLKLTVTNLVPDKTVEQLTEEFNKYFEGIIQIDITSPTSCLIVFNVHRNASSARRKLFSGRVRPFDVTVMVDWYVSPQEANDEAFKALYVRNIDKNMSDSQYSAIFGRYGTIVRLHRYTEATLFVHYSTRKSAEAAVTHLNKKLIGKCVVDVSFARPAKKDRREQQRNQIPQSTYVENPMLYSNFMPFFYSSPAGYNAYDYSTFPYLCCAPYGGDLWFPYDPYTCAGVPTVSQIYHCDVCIAAYCHGIGLPCSQSSLGNVNGDLINTADNGTSNGNGEKNGASDVHSENNGACDNTCDES